MEKIKEDLVKGKKENIATMDKLNKITTEYIQDNLEKDQQLKEVEGIKKTKEDLHKEIRGLIKKREESVKDIHEMNNLLEGKETVIAQLKRESKKLSLELANQKEIDKKSRI